MPGQFDNTGTPVPAVGSVWEPKDPRDGVRRTVLSTDGHFAYVQGAIRTRIRLPLTRRYRLVSEPAPKEARRG